MLRGRLTNTLTGAFYLNLLVGAVVAPVYFFVLPDFEPQPGISLRSRLAQLDYIGALGSAGAFLCIMMGMNFGGVLWSWENGRSIALFVLAAVLLVAFVLQQVFLIGTTMEYRMFPMHFWRNRTMVICFGNMSMSIGSSGRPYFKMDC